MPKNFGSFTDMFECAFDELYIFFSAYQAYNGSLDAAHSLHKAVLPRWYWSFPTEDIAVLWTQEEGMTVVHIDAENDTPARAWLIAIIKAKIAELETQENET